MAEHRSKLRFSRGCARPKARSQSKTPRRSRPRLRPGQDRRPRPEGPEAPARGGSVQPWFEGGQTPL